MKFITAFFMSWGNFLTIPCPYKRWDSKLKNMMLSLLPLVGGVVGIVWCIVIGVMRWINLNSDVTIPGQLAAIVGTFVIFSTCGFMHLDGYMDCSDAIMSRRPLEERQRILKDSNVGAFAVIMVVFLLIFWYASMEIAWKTAPIICFFIIPVCSRTFSGYNVLSRKPIGHSQYKDDYNLPGKRKLILLMYTTWILVILLSVVFFNIFFNCNSRQSYLTIITLIFVIGIVEEITCIYANRQLGGMSGDIAGLAICMGELSGVITLAIIYGM